MHVVTELYLELYSSKKDAMVKDTTVVLLRSQTVDQLDSLLGEEISI